MESRRMYWGIPALLVALGVAAPLQAQLLPAGEIHARVDAALPRAFELYREILTYPNDAHHPADILRLLGWLDARFQERGFSTERISTAGSPLLLAERRSSGAERTVLIYLQADGQPVDPSRWNQESPWVPVLKEPVAGGSWREIPWRRLELAVTAGAAERERLNPEWRIFARSASDSKGPIAQFLTAITLLDEAGITPDFHMKVIVDTQEEMGSPHLPAAVQRHREKLAADMLVIFDGPPHVSGRPTLKFGARGIATASITTYGPLAPQHSGHYGNYLPNPVFHLSRILASAKDADGRVTIPGWYDGVQLDAGTRRILAEVPDDEEAILRSMGVASRDLVGDNLQEAVQYPSLNVRGIRAGWVGSEARTIVPDEAVAELDIRLVAESDAERLIGLLRRHVEEQGFHVLSRAPTPEERRTIPRIATLTYNRAYGAFRTPFDSEPGRWLTGAFVHLHGDEPIRIRTSGGSIPIAPFVETLGVPAVSVPTVNPDNNQHSPNENLRVGSFVEGIRIVMAVLQQPVRKSGP
ncbi:MAG TPA: M20/M25/M40 family metallo-hydrolase [Gemmatimonadaceae bacterium]|nr:M20/M25/M40 family metallo-hydrolase [Gemmatimonadaceae bacterium]